MLPSVKAHAQVLSENHVLIRIFVAVLFVQLPDAAPLRGAVFLAGTPVHAGGIVKRDPACIHDQAAQHEFDGVGRPAQGKGLVHSVGKDRHELKEIHAVLIDACGQHSEIQNGQGKRRPHGGGVPERLLVYIGIPPKTCLTVKHIYRVLSLWRTGVFCFFCLATLPSSASFWRVEGFSSLCG